MQNQEKVIDCYDQTAENYAEKFIDELRGKHLDRILLKAFAAENADKGKVIDLGCGPGQTTAFLADSGLTDITGADISPQMIAAAKKINPQVNFQVADILNLKFSENSFAAALAFYSIVHFDYDQIAVAFREIKRVLTNGGQFLFAFHVGSETIHLDEFLDHTVDIDFYFFETKRIIELLIENGFETIDVIEREPYENAEHPSRRAYIWAKNKTKL